jgi:predicted alpha/beta hydrolase family esterase
VQNLDSPSILVGRSAGATTIVDWASGAASSSKVVGALLVAPPEMEAPLRGMPRPWMVRLGG